MVNYAIDKESDTPLYIQIRDVIQEAIRLGELQAGDRLPSVSSLAKEIGVTQATIRRALQDLSDAGQACCHVGRGTFIQNPESLETSHGELRDSRSTSSLAMNGNTFAASNNPLEYAARRLRMGVGKALRDIMSLADKPGIVHLTKGVPDPSFLPEKFLEEITRETLADKTANLLEATDPLGRYELRVEIAKRFSAEGTPVKPEQVLITNGSIQGVTLIAQENREIGRRIICETPCFKGITDTFASMGHWVETINRDSEGPIPDLLNQLPGGNPYLLYICPYAHNPMGTHLSPDRSRLVVEWAKKTGSTIVADELFKDLAWTDSPSSIMQDLGAEQTIIVSSLSKSIMTGLRCGWIISSAQRIEQLAQLKRLNDHACPTLIQGLALTIFRSGRFDSHTKKMAALYQQRRNAILKALGRYMPKDISWSKPDGGFSLLLELPHGYSSVALFLSAIDKGVSFLPGPLFDIDQRFVNCCRLSYAWSDESEIKEGIELLASAVEELIGRPPRESGLSGLGSYQ